MKRKALKGQSALEYMVTYGWMILVAGVVLVVLWQYGVFNPQRSPPGCTGFSQISPTDWKVDDDDGNLITLTILNNAGTKITLNSVNVTFYDEMCQWVPAAPIDMRAGESKQITVDASCAPGLTATPVEGDYYQAEMTFAYRNIASSIDHLSAGECHGTVE